MQPKLVAIGLAFVAAPISGQVVLEGSAVFDSTSPDNKETSDSTLFNAEVGDASYAATTSSFPLGAVGTDRRLVAAVIWRNSELAEVRFGGRALSEVAGSRVEGAANYRIAFLSLDEAGLQAATDDDFVVTMTSDSNTSLGLLAFVLSNAEQGELMQVDTAIATNVLPDPPAVRIELGGLPAGGFGFAAASIPPGAPNLADIDPTPDWVQVLNDASIDAHTGPEGSLATIEDFGGWALTADFAIGGDDGFGAREAIASLLYVAPSGMGGPAQLEVETLALPAGIEGQLYGQPLVASGGLPPYEWSVSAGALPAGLTLDAASGELGGTPVESGAFEFTVRVEDDAVPSASAIRVLELVIDPAPPSGGGEGGIVQPDGTLRTYMLGNSLTRGLSVGAGSTGNRLQQLFESSPEVSDYTYGTQLGAAFRLCGHLDKRAGTGGANYEQNGDYNFNNENSVGAPAFGDYDNALSNFTFDALVFQPFMTAVDFTNSGSGDFRNQFFTGDRQAINHFIDYASARTVAAAIGGGFGGRYLPEAGASRYDIDNPNPGNVATRTYYIYETWPNVGDVYDETVGDTYAEFWDQAYDPAAGGQASNPTIPCRDAFDQLVDLVNGDNPDLAVPVRVIPVGEVMYELDLRIRAGTLPGVAAFYGRSAVADYFADARDADGDGQVLDDFPFDGFDAARGVLNFYADGIHLNDQAHNDAESGTIGAYVASLTWYAVLTGRSPVGLGAGPFELLDETLDADLIEALQQCVWQVVLDDEDSGVRVVDAVLPVAGVAYDTTAGAFRVTVAGLDDGATYRLLRSSPGLDDFSTVVVSGHDPAVDGDTLSDPGPLPPGSAFYRVEEE